MNTTIDMRAIRSATDLSAALHPANPTARFARNKNDNALAQWDNGKWRGLFAMLIDGLGWSTYPDVVVNGEPIVDAWLPIPVDFDRCCFCGGAARLHPYGMIDADFDPNVDAQPRFEFACGVCDPLADGGAR